MSSPRLLLKVPWRENLEEVNHSLDASGGDDRLLGVLRGALLKQGAEGAEALHLPGQVESSGGGAAAWGRGLITAAAGGAGWVVGGGGGGVERLRS